MHIINALKCCHSQMEKECLPLIENQDSQLAKAFENIIVSSVSRRGIPDSWGDSCGYM